MPGPTLTDWLRGQDDQTLAELLLARPDLATPPPPDTGVLAARASTRASVTRAAEGLSTFTLAVLDALVVADADREPVAEDTVAGIVGPGAGPERVREALRTLSRLALAWGSPELSVAPAAREAGGLYPAGLGRPSSALVDADVTAMVADLADAERRLLTTLAHGSSPLGRTRDAAEVLPLVRAKTPVQRLLALGLLLRRDAETVELPRQVALAIRGDSPLGPVKLDEPELRTTGHRAATVDATGAGEALELLRRMESLLTLWTEEPAAVLKAGGLGLRDLRRLGRELDTDERGAGFVAELAFGTAMVADSGAISAEWQPTTLADPWLAATPANRWATLAAAWLDLPRLPGLAGMRDQKDKVLAPLSDDLRRPPAPAERRRVLETLAELPAGTGVSSPDDLAAVLAWRAPRRGGRLRDEIVRWTLAEATALGVVALGALTGPGRALLESDTATGPAAAAKRMADALPDPLDHVLVQADLTVVAPGPLEPTLAIDIGQVADVESAGSATVYRITEASVRRALDIGRTAEDLHELFRTRSRTPVPQALSYLIDDVARRHGRLRGGVAASFLRCDDPVLLAEVSAHPAAVRLELRRIAPTVLVSPVPLAEVLDELRQAGFAPAAEGADGQVLDLRRTGHRLPAPARPKRGGPPVPPSADRLQDIVSAMRAGDTAAGTRRGRTVSLTAGTGAADTSATLALLREAIERQHQVWIGFVDSRGVASQRVVDPFRVGGGVLEGRDVTHGAVRHYPLHRITSASLVEDSGQA